VAVESKLELRHKIFQAFQHSHLLRAALVIFLTALDLKSDEAYGFLVLEKLG
jgi:hypothetical protein